jgi:aromatic ring-opening dioxygenase catalytic subunit (LigB family)
MTQTRRALFLSHGGGPMPLLGDPGHTEMVNKLTEIANSITKPSAIIVVSAHWEEVSATVTSGQNPELIYDYYGFPPESYKITYPCAGHTELAVEIDRLLRKENVSSNLDATRGFDHGLFIPLKIMYPDADIPCVQISLLNNLDPKQHIELG